MKQDELEALKSIYDGDECFNVVDDTTFQYKVRIMLLLIIYKFSFL